jgi:hypothetical protein
MTLISAAPTTGTCANRIVAARASERAFMIPPGLTSREYLTPTGARMRALSLEG